MDESTTDSGLQDLPVSKAELLQRIDEAWAQVSAIIDGVPERVLTEPGVTGWSIKDHLSHITAWEQVLLRHYLRGEPLEAALGLEENAARDLDEDALNEAIFQHNQRRPQGEVLEAFRGSHGQVADVLGQTAFEELTAERPSATGESVSLLSLVAGNTYEHYVHHQGDIERLLTPPVLGD